MAGFVVLLLSSSDDEKEEPRAQDVEEEVERSAEPAPVVRREPVPEKPAPPAPAPSERDGLNVVGPHPDDPHEPGMAPHPITPEHERIFAENRTLQAMNDAMSFLDAKKMRELNVELRRLDPEDRYSLQEGYDVIADCIEFPGDASLAAARQYYYTKRHSTVRRFVRRICFEKSPEASLQRGARSE